MTEKSLNRDILGYLPVKLIPAITGLCSILLLTHHLTPVEYGTYSSVIAAVLLLVQLSGSWLANSTLFVYPDYLPIDRGQIEAATIKLQWIINVATMMLGFIVILSITNDGELAMIGSLHLGLLILQTLLSSFFQSRREVKRQAFAVGLQSIGQISALTFFIFYWKARTSFALLSILIGYALSIFSLSKGITFPKPESLLKLSPQDKIIFKKLANYGIPMCLWFFATQLFTIGDRILLKYFGYGESLGKYSSFRDLCVGCAGFLTMPLLMASHPVIMSMWKRGDKKEEISALLSRNIDLLIILFIPIFILLDLAGPELLSLLFGKRYSLPKEVMFFVVASIFLASITMYAQKGLEVTGLTIVLAKIALFTATIGTFLNLLIIPKMGVLGAAAAGCTSQAIYLSIAYISSRGKLACKCSLSLIFKVLIWATITECICHFPLFASRLHARVLIVFLGSIFLFLTEKNFRSLFINAATTIKARREIRTLTATS